MCYETRDSQIARLCYERDDLKRMLKAAEDGMERLRQENEELKALDVAPVVHAKWIPCDPDSDVRFYCSECGTEISTSWDYDCDEMWNGCPHCLARMDGE